MAVHPQRRRTGDSTGVAGGRVLPGLGGALKLVPLFLVPTQFLGGEKVRPARLLLFGLVAAFPVGLSCLVIFFLTGGEVSFLAHHAQRGVQIESLLASVVYFAQTYFSVFQIPINTNFGAQHMGEVPGLVPLSRGLLWGSVLFTYLLLWWNRRRWDALSGSWMVISGFVTFGYVLSPQFLLWLAPLGVCAAERVDPRRRLAWLGLLLAVMALTGAHFRYYWDYVNLFRLATAMVLLRNLLLVALWCLSWRWMGRRAFC